MLMRKTEENLHLKICDYLRKNYPDVLFRTDFSSGMKMSPGQAAKHKKFQKSRAWPDLFIAESNNFASGLFLEIKAENVIVFKRNGEIRKNKHLIEQDKMLKELRKKVIAQDSRLDIIKQFSKFRSISVNQNQRKSNFNN